MTRGNILKLKDFQSLTNSQFLNPNLKFAIELNWQFLKFPNIASALRKIRSSITQILCERLWSLGNKRKPQWCNIVFWYWGGESGRAISNLVSFRWCSTYPLCWDLLVSAELLTNYQLVEPAWLWESFSWGYEIEKGLRAVYYQLGLDQDYDFLSPCPPSKLMPVYLFFWLWWCDLIQKFFVFKRAISKKQFRTIVRIK